MTTPPTSRRRPFDPTQYGVPADALDRLSQNRAGTPGAVFTSDLSVNEFLLVREAGFRPLGLVLGSSIYHIGMQTSNWGKNMELTVLSQAMYHARELAMTRMEAEAYALGADGIVGVRLHVKPQEWGAGISEFIAVGTAVLSEKGGKWQDNRGRPFTSDLTGQDFWTLLQAGYAPGRTRAGHVRLSRRAPQVRPDAVEHGPERRGSRSSPKRSTMPGNSRWGGCRPRPTRWARKASSESR